MNHKNEIRWSEERANNYIDDEISKRKNQMEYYRILHHDSVVIDDEEYYRDKNRRLFCIHPILKSIPSEYINQKIIDKVFLNHDIFDLAMELYYIPKELRTEKLFVRYALLYPETLVSRIHGEYFGNWYEDYYEGYYGTNLLINQEEFTIPVMVAYWLGQRRWTIEEFYMYGDYGYDLQDDIRLAVEINQNTLDSIIAEKRKQATEIAWKIFCEKKFSEEWWLDNLYDNNKIDELFNLIMDYVQNKGISSQNNLDNIDYEGFKFYEEKLQDLNSKEEKKLWRLEKEEKAKIQTKSAEIARNYREQQETQTPNQPLQQQEDIKE